MPATGIRLHTAVLLGYVCLGVAFSWPLPLHLTTTLLGPVSSDLGVYVWNLWVFGHEVTAHGNFPYLTNEILPLTPPVPLTLHNYTTAANIVAFFLQPFAGTTATFNLLTFLSGALAAYAMFLLARRLTGDPVAAWIAGVAFGFCPFMNARAMEHFSLVQVAPLAFFILLFLRLRDQATLGVGALMGTTVAWAFLSDPYYAVYCVLVGVVLLVDGTFHVQLRPAAAAPRWRHALTVVLVTLGGVILGIAIGGGGQVELLGVRVSMTQLYTPVLAFTVMLMVRILLSRQAKVECVQPLPPARVFVVPAAVCILLLSPVLSALAVAYRDSELITPPVLWRSSAPGVDLVSFLLPNPLHPWFGGASARWLRGSPGGFVENVASIPWTALVVISVAVWAAAMPKLPRRWIVFTGVFLLLALGPFVRVAGVLTYIPTPWALLRYVPVIAAARMPTRFSILVMLGVAVLLAFALRALRDRSRRPGAVALAVAAVLIFELCPAPRTLHSAIAPSVIEVIARDPRNFRVLNLPFGLRDGLRSYGETNASPQYYQTVHQKPIIGGYLSRLPLEDVRVYQRHPVLAVMLALSEGKAASTEERASAIAHARENAGDLQVGYAVVDARRAPHELVEFAKEALALEYVTSDGPFVLYRCRLTPSP